MPKEFDQPVGVVIERELPAQSPDGVTERPHARAVGELIGQLLRLSEEESYS